MSQDAHTLAAHVDSAVAMAFSRVIINTLRELSPEADQILTRHLTQEVERQVEDAHLYQDAIAEAVAAVLRQTCGPQLVD